ncbi:MAG: hypothetical protein AAFO57_09815, partial [Pseudomonadota bacterium]
MQVRTFGLMALFAWLLSGCASTPPAPPPPAQVTEPPAPPPESPPTSFDGLTAWSDPDVLPGVSAFLRSCGALERRGESEWLSQRASWAGTVGEWRSVCASLEAAASDETTARQVFEALTVPVEI